MGEGYGGRGEEREGGGEGGRERGNGIKLMKLACFFVHSLRNSIHNRKISYLAHYS